MPSSCFCSSQELCSICFGHCAPKETSQVLHMWHAIKNTPFHVEPAHTTLFPSWVCLCVLFFLFAGTSHNHTQHCKMLRFLLLLFSFTLLLTSTTVQGSIMMHLQYFLIKCERSCKLDWAQPCERIWKEASGSPRSWGGQGWRLLFPSLQELSCHLQCPTAELPLHWSGASVRSEPCLHNVSHAHRHFHHVPLQLQTWTLTAEAWATKTSGRAALSPLYPQNHPGVKLMLRTIYFTKYFTN